MNSFLNSFLSKTNSLSNQVLIVVLSLFIFLILLLSTLQIINEFNYEKTKVENELTYISNSFTPSFAHALWEINIPQIQSLSKGALEQSVIVGISVYDTKNNLVVKKGQTQSQQKNVLLENKKIQANDKGLFWVTLKLEWLRDDLKFDVGYVVLYSSLDVVWERVKYGFLLILLSAIVQIVVFSLLFKIVIDRMLKKPLAQLTQITSETNLDNLEKIDINLHTYGKNELKIFEESLKNMRKKLLEEQNKRTQLFENQQQFLEDEVKRRTLEISNKESLYKTTIESIHSGLLAVDSNGKVTHSNKKFQKMWRIPKELLNSKDDHLLQQFVQDQVKDPQLFLKKIEELEMSNDVSFDIIEFKDGRIFERFSQPMVENGINMGRVWNFEDTTQRKKIERALQKNEAQLKMITDNAPASIAYVDLRTFQYLHVNQRFCDAYGLQITDIIGHHIKDIVGKDNFEFSLPYIKEAKKGKTVSYIDSFHLIRGDRWVNVNFTPDFDEKGEVRALFVMAHDITDRIESEEELIKARDEAQKANKAKSEFIANMSHEIRTPLNAVIGFSELLEQTTIDKKQQSYLESIRSGGKALLSLINDILDLSKIEAGKMNIKMEPLNLRDILDDIEQIFAFNVKDKKLNFNITINENIPKYIVLDEIRLRQILFNIIGNAIKFTHDGNIHISVEGKISNDEENKLKKLIIHVKDTGIGIPKDEQEKIFESFEQQKLQEDKNNNKIYEGTGLGLSITKKLVELMGGRIILYSKVNSGSTFSIYFYDVECYLDNSFEYEQEKEKETIHFNNQTLLIADDVESNRTLIKNILEDKEIELFEAIDGAQAVLMAKEINPDIIFMDIRMPNLDGIEATKQIREIEKIKNTPIVAITTKNQIDKEHELFNNILEKPISQKQIIEELKKYLSYKIEKINTTNEKKDIKLSNEILEKTLNEDIKNLLKRIEQSGEFDDIETFAKELKDLGEKENINEIIEYGKILNETVKNFDVKKIDKLLKIFEEYESK